MVLVAGTGGAQHPHPFSLHRGVGGLGCIMRASPHHSPSCLVLLEVPVDPGEEGRETSSPKQG